MIGGLRAIVFGRSLHPYGVPRLILGLAGKDRAGRAELAAPSGGHFFDY